MRRHAVPVGFLVREAKGNLTPEILGEWIAGEIGPALVAEAISDGLMAEETTSPDRPDWFDDLADDDLLSFNF